MADKGKQGFAAMDPEEHREVAAEGGRSSGKGKTATHDSGDDSHDSHHDAAFHHSTAAHHHRQAARHRKAGNHEGADRHAHAAHEHSTSAHEHSRRGFAAMDPERVRGLARKGGQASHGGRGGAAVADEPDETADRRTTRGRAATDEGHAEPNGKNGGHTPGGQGGSHEQHVKAGRQSHKSTHPDGDESDTDTADTQAAGTQGGSPEQHSKAGKTSHKAS